MYPTRKTTSGRKGVWVYEIGSSPFFTAITPGTVSDLPEEEEGATEPPVTMLPRQPNEQQEVVFSTYEPQEVPEEEDELPTETPAETPTEYQPSYPEAETTTRGYGETDNEEPDDGEPDQIETQYPESESVTPTYTYPERTQPTDPSEPRYPDQTETAYPVPEPVQPIYTIPETIEPRYSPVEPRYSEPDRVEPRYTDPDPVQPVPPYSQPHQPQIVVVDEDEDLDVNGKSEKLKRFCA